MNEREKLIEAMADVISDGIENEKWSSDIALAAYDALAPLIRAGALEEAAKACERFAEAHRVGVVRLPLAERAIPIAQADGASMCSTAIRALKEG